MKGLLLKDLLSIRRQYKILLLLTLFYFVFSVGNHNTSFLQGIVVLFCVMMSISSVAYDEAVKWDRYALSLPVSRKTVVCSKYVLGILLDIGGSLVALLLSLLTCAVTKDGQISEVFMVSLVIFGVGLLFLSLILPLLFRFGAEKGRLVMFAVVFLPIIAAFLLKRLGVSPSDLKWNPMYEYIAPVILLGLLLCSVFISTKIYLKKEF